MKIISVVCQKGGAGKTTIATNLAVLAERAGYPTVLFDLDPQATAAKLGDKLDGTPPDVVAAQAGRLGRTRLALHRHRATRNSSRPQLAKVILWGLVTAVPESHNPVRFSRG